MPKKKSRLSSFVDWLGAWVALEGVLWVTMWAAQSGSDALTAEQTLLRSLLYSVPIALAMWGASRVSRRGSSVPSDIARTIPWIQVKPDGSLAGTNVDEAKHHVPPTPLDPNGEQS